MHSRILIFIISILITSCISVEICDDDDNSVMVAKFMTLKDELPADSTVASLSLYGIREGRSDSLLYNNQLATNTFEAPLDPHHDITRFVLQINDQTDTLELIHTKELYMISYDCGFGNLFTLDDNIGISSGVIKSTKIKDEKVDAETEQDDVHIWLFL
jgi:hypothetical protein